MFRGTAFQIITGFSCLAILACSTTTKGADAPASAPAATQPVLILKDGATDRQISAHVLPRVPKFEMPTAPPHSAAKLNKSSIRPFPDLRQNSVRAESEHGLPLVDRQIPRVLGNLKYGTSCIAPG